MNFALTFVCQAGELEIKSLLLALSLKRHLVGDYECIAAIPHPPSQWGTVSPTTLQLFQTLGIRTVPITNPIHNNYPIGHKIACLGITTTAKKLIFLDSDLLCLRPFPLSFPAPFSAKPADLATFTYDLIAWQRMYQLFKLEFPRWRTLSSVTGELMIPYFNAGMIVIDNHLNFAEIWADSCRQIDADPNIPNKRPWLDQFGLSMTLLRLKINHFALDERFNFPAHLKPLPSQLPFLVHYHCPTVIRREFPLLQLVRELIQNYPQLTELLASEARYAPLLQPWQLKPRKSWRSRWMPRHSRPTVTAKLPLPEVLITGIPRSGTSYLCRLLHSLQDCVVINEPVPVHAPLIKDYYPWDVAIYYRNMRRDILEGLPIENKVQAGQVIEDTRIIDQRSHYHPQVTCPDFLLATKNTLAYLARIPHLRRVMPTALQVACVRHPLDTVASWKSSFPHLQRAQVQQFPVGHPTDPLLSRWQQQRLAEIETNTCEAVKRALLWRYLAEYVLMNESGMLLIRYEDLVTEPAQLLKRILAKLPHAPAYCPLLPILPSTVRQQRMVLNIEDYQAVTDICGESALALGYDLTQFV